MKCAVLMLLCACATAPEPVRPTARASEAPQQGALAKLYDASGTPLDRVEPDASAAPESAQVLHTPPARPRRVGPRDVRFHSARLDDALRALAAAGRFDLVVPEPLAQQVNLELDRVEPYDALMVLAESYDLAVSYHRGAVIVAVGDKPQP